jgi:xylan 1,4-beta-xylosidase
MTLIATNPILTGFNPDPCIIRTGEDFYLATSTFEWFPGVVIYHSKDLKNWGMVSKPLSRVSQLNLEGNDSSGGVCAPCLSHDGAKYYLTYSNLRNFENWVMDVDNFIVSANDVDGQWSEPVRIPVYAIDVSLFHHPDGSKWLVYPKSQVGICIRQYDVEKGCFVGSEHHIFDSTYLKITEGPHIYIHNDFYYLITAEGGTGALHSVTIGRSKTLTGKYELDPRFPMLTSKDDTELRLQKSGHASIVDSPGGQYYMVHLCARYIPNTKLCPMGRETALQKIVFDEEGWIRLANGSNKPDNAVEIENMSEQPCLPEITRDDFNSDQLDIVYQFSRVPLDQSECNLSAREGYLRLYGCSHLGSRFKQGLVARRQKSFVCSFETCFEFEPSGCYQTAGLGLYYNLRNYIYCYITRTATGTKVVEVASCKDRKVTKLISTEIDSSKYYIRGERDNGNLSFRYSLDGTTFITLVDNIDSSHISDDYFSDAFSYYTGSMIVIACEDFEKAGHFADFDYFEYRDLDVSKP